jgi:predicted RNA-binding Zn ribbon-like protein
MEARTAVRDLLAAVSAGGRGPRAAVETLNALSRGAPEWQELDESSWRVETRSDSRAGKRLLARYARSAMELVATEAERLRRCPAPSCGMFYVSTRGSQRWCSTQCGTRARVARHYRSRRGAS